jgi:hypothetical protein
MRAKPRHVQQCWASWALHPLSQQGKAKRSRKRSTPVTYLLGRPIAQKEPISVERHHTAETVGRTVHLSADPPHCKPAGAQAGKKYLRSQHS